MAHPAFEIRSRSDASLEQLYNKTNVWVTSRHADGRSQNVFLTLFLVFVNIHLPGLLEAQSVDDGHSQSESFPGVTVRAKGVDSGTRRWDVVWFVNRNALVTHISKAFCTHQWVSFSPNRLTRHTELTQAWCTVPPQHNATVSDSWLKLQNLTDLCWKLLTADTASNISRITGVFSVELDTVCIWPSLVYLWN